MTAFFIIFMIFFAYYRWTDWHRNSSNNGKGNTIGQSVKRDGYHYTNIGDLDNNDNWVVIDKYLPIYYVNVIQTGENEYLIKIEDTPNEKAIHEKECEAEEEVKTYVQIMHDIYSKEGTVKIDKRMKEIERILLMHPFYREKREWSQG